MIELKVLDARFSCKTKEQLWHQELKQTILLIKNNHLSFAEIKKLNKEQNIYNASSESFSNEICNAAIRRLKAVNDVFMSFYLSENSETQKLMSFMTIMLTDRTAFEFMDRVFKEKLILGDKKINDSEFLEYMHDLQNQDTNAAKWTDAGIKRWRTYIKTSLMEAELVEDNGQSNRILHPIIGDRFKSFLLDEGLEPIYKIFAGER